MGVSVCPCQKDIIYSCEQGEIALCASFYDVVRNVSSQMTELASAECLHGNLLSFLHAVKMNKLFYPAKKSHYDKPFTD